MADNSRNGAAGLLGMTVGQKVVLFEAKTGRSFALGNAETLAALPRVVSGRTGRRRRRWSRKRRLEKVAVVRAFRNDAFQWIERTFCLEERR